MPLQGLSPALAGLQDTTRGVHTGLVGVRRGGFP